MSVRVDQALGLPLRFVFVGRNNPFNRFMVRWLARQMHLVGIVWADIHRETWGWRWKWFRRAVKRGGPLQILGEIHFRYWCLTSWELDSGMGLLLEDIESLFSDYCHRITAEQGEISAASVNTPEVLDYVRSCRPDVGFIVCISQFVKSELANIPRLGTFVYHEGITPEYRGVHTPFWAIANGDDDKVGYTLLKINEVFDAGSVYAQGATHLHTLKTPLGYIGHGALVEGLEDVARFLKGMNDGSVQPIDVTGRPDGYYSYFRYSQLKRIFARRREAGIVVGPEQASSFCRLPDL